MIKYLLLSVLGGLILAAPSFLVGFIFDSPALMVTSLVLICLPTSGLVWAMIAYREDFDMELRDLIDREK
jgi:hypothetical protein